MEKIMLKPIRLYKASWILHCSKIAIATFLVFGSIQALSTLYGNTRPKRDVGSDVIEFWATGKLLRAYESPYDLPRVYQLELVEGMKGDTPHYNFGPPVALPFWLPLGFMSLRMAS